MQIKFPLKKFKPHTNKGTCALQNPGFGFSEPKVLGKKKKSWRLSAIPNCGWAHPSLISREIKFMCFSFIYTQLIKMRFGKSNGLPRRLPRLFSAMLSSVGKWAWPRAISFVGGWSSTWNARRPDQLDTACDRLTDMCGLRGQWSSPCLRAGLRWEPGLFHLALFSLLIHSCHQQPFLSGSASF